MVLSFELEGKTTDGEDVLVKRINWGRCLGTCPTCLIYIDWNRPAMKNRQEAIVLDRVSVDATRSRDGEGVSDVTSPCDDVCTMHRAYL